MQITGNEVTVTVKDMEGKWEIIGCREINEEQFFLLLRADSKEPKECIIADEEGTAVAVDLDLQSPGEFSDALNEYFMERGDGPLPDESTRTYLPVYAHDYFYAVDHGEEDLFRQSNEQNIACKKCIEQSINEHFDGMYLDSGVVTPVLNEFGSERMAFVLSATVEFNNWDGRFSGENKRWAADQGWAFYDGGDRNVRTCVINSHPALLNGFIDLFRKEAKVPDHMSLFDFEREFRYGKKEEKSLFKGPNGQYGIYRLRENFPGKSYEFMYLDYIEKAGLKVRGGDYDLIYVSDITPGMGFEDISREFNTQFPDHSLAVSDVIVTKEEDRLMAYYVNRTGCRKLENFVAERLAVLDPSFHIGPNWETEKALRMEPAPEKKEKARTR